jgi:hypothetical protein
MNAPKNPVSPCHNCGHELLSDDEARDADFCKYCLPDYPADDDNYVDDEEDEDFPTTMEDPHEAALDRIHKESERVDD